MILVLVVGLPGSGKTQYAHARASREGLVLVDDPTGLEALDVLESRSGIVTDPHLCCSETRAKAEHTLRKRFPGVVLEWVFFENDPDACFANVGRRQKAGDSRMVAGMIWGASKRYQIPEGVLVLPVWRP